MTTETTNPHAKIPEILTLSCQFAGAARKVEARRKALEAAARDQAFDTPERRIARATRAQSDLDDAETEKARVAFALLLACQKYGAAWHEEVDGAYGAGFEEGQRGAEGDREPPAWTDLD